MSHFFQVSDGYSLDAQYSLRHSPYRVEEHGLGWDGGDVVPAQPRRNWLQEIGVANRNTDEPQRKVSEFHIT